MAEKFLFDQDFDTPGSKGSWASRRRKVEETFTRADLDQARQEGFEEGQAAGRAQAESEIASMSAAALGMMASAIDECRHELSAIAEQQGRDAARIGAGIGRRLAEKLLEAYPMQEIEALVKGCLQELRDEPRLVIRTSEPVAENLRDRIDQMASGVGFSGRVVLLPDDTMGPQDCRVEWADGGAGRDYRTINRAIDQAVGRFLGDSDDADDQMIGHSHDDFTGGRE